MVCQRRVPASDPKETQSAITLAALVKGDAELFTLWQQLSEPFDAFLHRRRWHHTGIHCRRNIGLGTNLQTTLISGAQLAEIQKKLDGELSLPQVSDQLLRRRNTAEFPKQTRGFRLLPPRRLPDAVCFHNTVDPKIPGRLYPSGLDFLAASRCYARRLLCVRFKASSVKVSATSCSRRIVDRCQIRSTVKRCNYWQPCKAITSIRPGPTANRGVVRLAALDATGSLGRTATHMGAAHQTQCGIHGMISPPTGMVAPYPEFFAGWQN